MNKAVIFDLDGTLIDSVPDITFNLNLALSNFGFNAVAESDVKDIIGHGARNLVLNAIGKSVSDETLDKVLNFYNNIYTESPFVKTKTYFGVNDMLGELVKRGYLLAVCSNKPQVTTEKIVKTAFVPRLFSVVSGYAPGGALKPDKKAVTDVLDKLCVSPENAFLIGDMVTDAVAALRAGVKFIAAQWGYGKAESLIASGTTAFAASPAEILKFIR